MAWHNMAKKTYTGTHRLKLVSIITKCSLRTDMDHDDRCIYLTGIGKLASVAERCSGKRIENNLQVYRCKKTKTHLA